MLYIISFQSISCREASPTSPCPHKGPPEGSSVRLKGRGFGRAAGHFDRAPQYKVLYRPATQSSDRASPRSFPQSSTRFSSRCSARPSGRSLKTILKPAREAVFATATLPIGTSVPSRRGKAVIYHPFATATLSTGTPVASRRAEQSHNLSQTGLKMTLDRSSPRPPCLQVLQCHPHVPRRPKTDL